MRDHDRFPALDGLRALAVLLVITAHQGDDLVRPLHGYLGVTVFFVISGFLITTLLIREEAKRGSVSLAGFYVRRAFRILPLYYIALIANIVLVYVVDLGSDKARFTDNLPYFWTYTNEFAEPGTFGHSWSLGIEEKFYIVWPFLAFTLVAARRARPLTVTLLVAGALGSAWIDALHYFAIYIPILAGCALAVVSANPRSQRALTLLARSPVALALLVATCVVAHFDATDDHVHPWFSIVTALAFPGFVVGDTVLNRIFSNGFLSWIGRRSYAVYLVHPIVGSAVDRAIGIGGPTHAVLRFVGFTAGSLLVAEVLARAVELPLISVGRRISRQFVARHDAGTPSAAASGRT